MPRPSQNRLSRDRIARKALALLDRHGEFSMIELADALGVTVSSLYHHVKGRGETIDLVRDLVVSEIDAQMFRDLTWDDALQAWARSYRKAFARHPAAIRLLATETVASPAALSMYETVVGGFLQAGFHPSVIMPAITVVESFVLGSALDLAAPTIMVHVSNRDQAPNLAAVLAESPSDGRRAEIAFSVGLDALLVGLRAQLDGGREIPLDALR